MKRTMIIGASGVFGSRLAGLLDCERHLTLVLAGRTLDKLEAINAALSSSCEIRQIDRDTIKAKDLQDIDLVIDAAGPFQLSGWAVIEAAMAAGCDYIDLADGRAFVGSIGKYDAAAKKAGVAVVSGASSIPALSHAVLDELTQGWRQIDDIYIGIFPGNRAPRGKSVVESILSYTGKPVRVFREGAWQEQPGWGMLHRRDMPYVGKRWASLCDTPEQDLLVQRYKPTNSAEFFAGMELSILHLGLSALAMPVRWGWVKSLAPAESPLLWLAKRFLPFGSDEGAMDVEVSGLDGSGKPATSRWTLKADANRGPHVPVLAAAILVRQIRDGRKLPQGGYAMQRHVRTD